MKKPPLPKGWTRTKDGRFRNAAGQSWADASAVPRLCIVLEDPGMRVVYMPKVTILTDRGVPQTLDVLVKVEKGDKVLWLSVEIDEDPLPTRESLYRESIVGMPTLRVGPERLLSDDFMPWFKRSLSDLVDAHGTVEELDAA